MGEWSKKIGEYGENLVERFLSVIGWNDPVKGITIPCYMQNGEHKNDKEESVKTHGIDFMYSYMNPLLTILLFLQNIQWTNILIVQLKNLSGTLRI